jgi:uncharacterized membrane protein YbhN (UPF0104 family)
MAQPVRTIQQRRPRWWWELLLVAGGYEIYHQAQLHAPATAAVRHGWGILDAERWTHLDLERWVNALFAHRAWLALPAEYYYELLHFGVTIGVLVWLWWRHPDRYRPARRILAAGSLISLAIFWIFPAAPPRLLPGAGFVDTGIAYHSIFNLETGNAAKATSDLFASMPSLHMGWALWSAAAVAGTLHRPLARRLVWVYPALTALVVMGTANHFFFDLVGGALVMALGVALTVWLPEAAHRRAPVPVPAVAWAGRFALIAAPVALAATVATQHRFLDGAVRAVTHAQLAWLAGAVAVELVSMSAFSRLERRTLKVTGVNVRLRAAQTINYASNAVSRSVPVLGTAAGMANTWRLYRRRGAPAPAVTWALGATSVASSLAFVLLIAVGAVTSGNVAAIGAGVGAATGGLALLVLVVLGPRVPTLRTWLERLAAAGVTMTRRLRRRPSLRDTRVAARRAVSQLSAYRLRPADALLAFADAIVNWAFDIACLALSIHAVGAHVPAHELIVIWAAGQVAGSLAFTPGGLGIVEPILAAGLVVAGMPHAPALAATVLYRLISFLGVVAAGWAAQFVARRTAPAEISSISDPTPTTPAKAA